jgi:Xaa-Pro aminopeptidase
MKERFPLHTYHRLAPLITRQRLVKTNEEIDLMKRACDITGQAFERVMKFVKPGVNEYEIEAEMTHEFIRRGARGHAYQPIIGSGKNGLVLHYIENSDTCRAGDLLLMDFGAEVSNYAADCSRTIPVSGKFSPRQRACYEAVLKVQEEAINLFVPGTTIDAINKQVWSLMEKEMIGLGLFTSKEVSEQNPEHPVFFKYLMHGVAHFIGLDVHDVGGKYQKLEKGMVLTIEPGLYIKEENIAIRIEDNIVVDDTPRNLMKNIPKDPDEIEQRMSR